MLRRDILRTGLAGAAALAFSSPSLAQGRSADPSGSVRGTAEAPFTFDALSDLARRLAAEPYAAPANALPDVVAALDYDGHRAIRYRPDQALWRAEPVDFHLQAFYPGWVFDTLTEIFVGRDGVYEHHVFDSAEFEYRPPLNAADFENVDLQGVAGFRIHAPIERPDYFDELVTFLGASYFRALGHGTRYGLSARGLAINTATGTPEEFPRFSTFYIEKPQPGEETIRLMALMESQSLSGAYRFEITPGRNTEMRVTKRLFFREGVARLGVAPLTSMYAFGENDRPGINDFRPEVHDSDGLYVERASGERLWRPLRNPDQLALSFLSETSPRAFGLLQRDRRFDSYADIEARYELRPSLVVEPLGEWGRGVIELVEIPTDSEANDNIVAFWIPDHTPAAGDEMEFSYLMRWGLDPVSPDLFAEVGSTYVGVGGNAAEANTDTTRIAIDFYGGTAASLPEDADVAAEVVVGDSARVIHQAVSRLPGEGWRVSLELEKTEASVTELRVKLSFMQRIISETWLYQWT